MVEITTRKENNKAWISGKLETNFEFSHKTMLESFYKTRVEVARQSGTADYVPIIVSEQLLDYSSYTNVKGKYVEVGGNFRSCNKTREDGSNCLELFLFATTFIIYSDESETEEADSNSIFLDGNLCKEPVYRTTPFGREITDFMLAVNRDYRKTDYIPCITWGRSAQYASHFEVGDRVQLYGRIQSREYTKLLPDFTSETRVAYEISALSIAKVYED